MTDPTFITQAKARQQLRDVGRREGALVALKAAIAITAERADLLGDQMMELARQQELLLDELEDFYPELDVEAVLTEVLVNG